MEDLGFWHKQFEKREISKGSGKYEDFILCQRIVQMDGKLSVTRYNELLKIAKDYVGVKKGE